MHDPKAIEAVMDSLPDLPADDLAHTQGFLKHLAAIAALDALAAEGFRLYRPDDCAPVLISSHLSQSFARCGCKDAEFLLVPVPEAPDAH